MIKIIRLSLFVSFFVWAVFSQASVKSFVKKHPNLNLKSNFSKVVKNLFGGDEHPAYIQGDFDGDGKADQVAMITRSQKDYVCVFSASLSNSPFCKAMPNRDPKRYLSKVEARSVVFRDRRSSVDLYQIEYYLGATQAYYIENGKITEFTLEKGEVRQ